VSVLYDVIMIKFLHRNCCGKTFCVSKDRASVTDVWQWSNIHCKIHREQTC